MRPFIAIMVGLLNIYAVGAQLRPAVSDRRADPTQTVGHFEAHGELAAQAILRLGIATKTPIGLVLMPGPCTVEIDVNEDQQSIAAILDQAVGQIGGYGWSLRDGVILIVPRTVPPNSLRILDATIPKYANTAASMGESAEYLWMQVRGVLQPGQGFIFDALSSPSDAQVPAIEMRNASTEDVLDRVVVKGGGGAWVLMPVSTDTDRLPEQSLIKVFGYQDPGAEEAVSRICRTEEKPQQPH